jgi:hypothetical protein
MAQSRGMSEQDYAALVMAGMTHGGHQPGGPRPRPDIARIRAVAEGP